MKDKDVEGILSLLLEKVDKRAEHDEEVISLLTAQNKCICETYSAQIDSLSKARDNAYHQIEMQAVVISKQQDTIAKQNDTINRLQSKISKCLGKSMELLDKSKNGVTINQ